MTRHAQHRRARLTIGRAPQTLPPLRAAAPEPLEISMTDTTQAFAVTIPPAKRPIHRVNVASRFRQVAALEMAAIREREDADIEEIRRRAKQDLAYWQGLLDQVEETAPDVAPKAGPAPYAQPAIEAADDVKDCVVVEVAFPDQPDLCEDPDATIARIGELHEELESGAAS
jgi:hypothetical protein